MKNNYLRLFFWSGLFLCLILITTCKELEKSMLVATDEAANVLTNSADLPGQIIDLGGGATQHGHYYGKSDNPTASHTTLGSPASVSGFTSQLTGLEAGTKYLFKAYITDGQETVYGKEKSFTTVAASAPTLTTTAITSVTLTGAVSGGNITSDGGAPVTARGVCWNSFTAPTTSNNKTTDASGTGTFTSTLTGLAAGSTYFVRAYATNSAGTTYGNELTFTSTAASVPTVTTNIIANISFNGALGGGEVVSDGGSPVLSRGVCWSTATGPTISNTKTTNGSGTGSFASDISGLSPTTKYYVRSYATNIVGTAYGSEVSFTTSNAPVQLPVITTVSPGNVTSISATSGGDISSDGGSAVTSRGVCWNGTGSPTLGGNQTVDGSGTGSFASTLTGLAPNTKYYVRAYAVNAVGTAYGNEYSFTTLSLSSAVLTTTAITSIAQTTASGGGNITSDGGSSITVQGVCWSLNQNPTLADSFTDNGTGTGIFSSQLTNLSPGKTYFVRAYATNASGTTYGNQVSFLTASDIPKVTTSAIGTVTSTTAQAGGEVLDNNGSTVTTRGICYNTIGSPTILDNVKSESAAIGVFSLSLTSLTPNTTYYIRAFATNAIGTAYGAQVQFATPISSATITTTAATSITTTTATSGGVISADGGSSVTARGVCWSTSTNPVTGTATMTNDGTGLGTFTSALTGLSPNTKYYIRAYAINGLGTTYGDELTFTTNTVTATVPGAPTGLSATGGNAKATVTFTPPASDGGSAITGYTATANPGGLTGTGTASPVIINGLSNGTAYTFTVTATNVIGTGPASSASNSVTPSTVPGAPTIGTATTGNAQATVTFTVPASDGGSVITGYTVTSNPGGITATGGTSPIVVTGLANTPYTFTVTATNANGTGAASSPSNSVTPTLIPGAPTIGTATAGDAYASVTFTPPVSDGGSLITVYKVTSNPGGIFGTGVVSPVNVTGLTNGTAYTFTVTATNINGQGPASAASNSVTPFSIPILTTASVTTITSTSALSGGSITSNGGSTVTSSGVCWSTSTNPVATGNHTIDGTAIGTFTSSITALTANTTYYVRAYAINSAGTGYGNELSFTTNYLPPIAAIAAATSVTNTSAIINGAVSANISSTTVTFEYGTTSLYGSTINSVPGTVTGTTPINVSAALTGLIPGTMYHFRIVAVNAGGTSYSSDLTFTTTQLPTAVTEAATNIVNTTVTLNGIVNGNNLSTIATFEYGPTSSYGFTVNAIPNPVTGLDPVTVSAALTNLSPETTYHFRVYAENSSGITFGEDKMFTTICVGPIASTTAATDVLVTTATINGTANGNFSTTTLTFEYGSSTSYGSTINATPLSVTGGSINTVSALLTALLPSNGYHYRIKAVNCGGTTYGEDQSFTTLCAPPSAQTNAITLPGDTYATLNGNVNANNFLTNISFEYGTTIGYGNIKTAVPSSVTGNSNTSVTYAITGLVTNTLYHYRVKAESCGGIIYGDDQIFTTMCTAPNATTNAASGVGANSATLNGTVNANTLSTTVLFQYGTTTSYGNSITAIESPLNGGSNTSVTAGLSTFTTNTAYHYRVVSSNCGGTINGTDMSFTTLPTMNTTAISNITTSTASSGGTVVVGGNATITARGVCWGTSSNPTISGNKTSNGTGTGSFSSSLTGLSPNTMYYVRAYATNAGGTAYGDELSFITSLTVTHTAGTVAPVTKTVTYGIVRSTLYTIALRWITQNLGATNQATSATDATESAAGWYWQFNRMQGYKHDGSTRTPATAWITAINESSAWTASNDPCTILLGSGWRLPSSTEWVVTDSNGGWANYTDSYASILKIHAAGFLQSVDGGLTSRGVGGYYWSSVQYNNTLSLGYFNSSSSSSVSTSINKAYGQSVRCVSY